MLKDEPRQQKAPGVATIFPQTSAFRREQSRSNRMVKLGGSDSAEAFVLRIGCDILRESHGIGHCTRKPGTVLSGQTGRILQARANILLQCLMGAQLSDGALHGVEALMLLVPSHNRPR